MMEMKNQNNIEHQYLKLLKDILDNGVEKQDRTSTGTISVFGRQIRHDMKLGFPLLTTKKMAWKSIVTELMWFLRGDTNIKYLVDNNCHIWDGDAYQFYLNNYSKDLGDGKYESLGSDIKWVSDDEWPNGKALAYTKEEFINKIKTDDDFAKKWGELGPIYGAQWRSWEHNTGDTWAGMKHNQSIKTKIDQIQNLINDLKTNPDSRRLMVNAWNVGELDQMILPPCHNLWQMYSVEKEGKRHLSIMVNIRSNDVPLGLPFNIASYALLLEIIARMVDMTPDELIINIGDAHIYLNQIEGVREQLTREPYPLSTLKIVGYPEEYINPDNEKLFEEFEISDFKVENYYSHPSIKIPLSN
jgi:thymidylate synthase